MSERVSLIPQTAVQLGHGLADIARVLSHDEEWAGALSYCEFSHRVLKTRTVPTGAEPGEWTDIDTVLLKLWWTSHGGREPTTQNVDDGVMAAAQRGRRHPVVDYLEGLEWDGTERLPHWLADYFGTQQTPYEAAVGTLWLISAVARVMSPGCKADGVLIIEGPQGIGKSTGLSVLGGEWFSDAHLVLGDKDALQQLQGVWILELSELDSLNKADTVKAKQFFSTAIDRYRPSYGRRTQGFPRQCVFAGTTNQDAYLRDATGNRRYWPVRATEIAIDALRAQRDQLWAEAVARYRRGEPWWPKGEVVELFREQQEQRFVADAWQDLIEQWVADIMRREQQHFTLGQILAGALRLEAHQMKPPEQVRVGLIMTALGWAKRKRTITDEQGRKRRAYVYVRPEVSE